jgi:hypothetical protein
MPLILTAVGVISYISASCFKDSLSKIVAESMYRREGLFVPNGEIKDMRVSYTQLSDHGGIYNGEMTLRVGDHVPHEFKFRDGRVFTTDTRVIGIANYNVGTRGYEMGTTIIEQNGEIFIVTTENMEGMSIDELIEATIKVHDTLVSEGFPKGFIIGSALGTLLNDGGPSFINFLEEVSGRNLWRIINQYCYIR